MGGAERGPRHGGARPPSFSCMSMACINTAGVTQRNGQSVLRLSASFYSTSSEHVCRGVNLPRLVCRISLESFFFRVKFVSFILVSQRHTDPTPANTLPRASSGSWRDSKAARRHPAHRQRVPAVQGHSRLVKTCVQMSAPHRRSHTRRCCIRGAAATLALRTTRQATAPSGSPSRHRRDLT